MINWSVGIMSILLGAVIGSIGMVVLAYFVSYAWSKGQYDALTRIWKRRKEKTL